MVDLLPSLNVSQDTELHRFPEEIRSRLCGFTARNLCTHPEGTYPHLFWIARLLSQLSKVGLPHSNCATSCEEGSFSGAVSGSNRQFNVLSAGPREGAAHGFVGGDPTTDERVVIQKNAHPLALPSSCDIFDRSCTMNVDSMVVGLASRQAQRHDRRGMDNCHHPEVAFEAGRKRAIKSRRAE
jgi:hypothetical protein